MNTWAPAMNPSSHRQHGPNAHRGSHSPPSPQPRVVDHDATSGERSYAMFTHLAPIAASVLSVGIPGLSIIAPLVMWQVRKNDSPFLDDHGREAVNFQITILLFSIASLITLGLMYVPILIFSIVVSIIGAVAANKGEFYRYPCCLRLISG